MKHIQEVGQSQPNYPSSLVRHGQNITVPFANLGVAPWIGVGNGGFAVQYGTPRGADVTELLSHRKPGASFDKWLDHALDSISAATSSCIGAYRWAIQCGKSGTPFADLADSGEFVRFGALF